jgi:hypothetical protein
MTRGTPHSPDTGTPDTISGGRVMDEEPRHLARFQTPLSNDPITLRLVALADPAVGRRTSYSRCSSIREHRACFSGSRRAGPPASTGRGAPGCCVPGTAGPRVAPRPAGGRDRAPGGARTPSAPSDNGRADRPQRPAVRPEGGRPAWVSPPALIRTDIRSTSGVTGPTVGTSHGARLDGPGWDAGSGPRPLARRSYPVRPARGGTVGAPGDRFPGGSACRQE